jgi:hypothetical protein
MYTNTRRRGLPRGSLRFTPRQAMSRSEDGKHSPVSSDPKMATWQLGNSDLSSRLTSLAAVARAACSVAVGLTRSQKRYAANIIPMRYTRRLIKG